MHFTKPTALFSLLAISLPASHAWATERFAVYLKNYDNFTACRLDLPLKSEWYGDGECHHLSDSRLDVGEIHDACRIFIYENNDCTGWERQVYTGEMCIDIKKFFSVKAFCH